MKNRDLILSYLGSFESGDPSLIADHVADEFENNQMGLLGRKFAGKSLYKERLTLFLSQFKKLRYVANEIIESDNHLAVAYTMLAEDNGKPLEIEGMMFFDIVDERISKRSDCWDGLSYLQQMGVDLQKIGISS